MAKGEPRRHRIADLVVRLGGLWVLSGALFKLLLGTPGDLPSIVRELPLELGLTYKLVISGELIIAILALVVPRLAWPAVAALMALFCALLVKLWAAGDANCGCFGSSISFPPSAMLLIDAALLVAILAQRPWKGWRFARWRPAGVAAALALLLAATPWILDREVSAAPGGAGEVVAAPARLAGYGVLDVESWVGAPLPQTELARWIDLARLPDDGVWVFYRNACEHCADHLFELTAMDDGSRPIVLLRIVEAGDNEENRIVDLLPEGEHVFMVELPETVDWVITTPAELELESGRIVRAREGS